MHRKQQKELDYSLLRQFFRFVTSAVDLWYTKHSTPNRLGIEAPCMKYGDDKFQTTKELVII